MGSVREDKQQQQHTQSWQLQGYNRRAERNKYPSCFGGRERETERERDRQTERQTETEIICKPTSWLGKSEKKQLSDTGVCWGGGREKKNTNTPRKEREKKKKKKKRTRKTDH